MYLKRLEIHGFKSFAAKTTLEFSQGIIAIVGPNGSGKSNVADCLRWVLGEQSSKLIRGKSSSDVIFAGSEKKSKMGFAEVVATFENADHRIPVDSSEVSIGRRIDRSGESEYLINGNRVRLLDVVDLVLRSNIGTSRYTVIGQGTIDQMILAGPPEVKNLLDEASGVKNYYIKRERTLRRLEQTAQNLMRAEDLIAEIEPRLKSLRRQAKRMEARAEYEQELKIHLREFLGSQFWVLQNQTSALNSQLAGLAERRVQVEQNIAGRRKEAEALEVQNMDQLNHFREIQEHLGKLQNQKNKLLEDLSLIRGKMQSQKTAGSAGDAKTLQVQAHELSRKLEEVTAQIAATAQDRVMAEQAAGEAAKQLQVINTALDALYKQMQTPQVIDWRLFELQLNNLDKELEEFNKSLEQGLDLQQIKELAGHLRKQFEEFRVVAKNTAQNPEGSLHAIKEDLDRQIAERDRLSAQVKGLETDLSRSAISLEFMEKDKKQLQQERLHLDLELKKAQSVSQDEFLRSMIEEETKILGEVDVLAGEIAKVENLFKEEQGQEAQKQRHLHELESQLRQMQDDHSKIKDQEALVGIEKAKVETQMQNITEQIRRSLGEEIFKNIQEQPIVVQTEGLEEKIGRLRNQLEMIGGMDELTLKEYQETEARFNNLTAQVEDLQRGMNDLRAALDELDEHIKKKFNDSFFKINEKFEYYFRVLFNGGRAYLSVMKDKDAAEELSEDNQDIGKGLDPSRLARAEEYRSAQEDAAVPADDSLRPEERIVKKYEQGPSNIIGIDIKATPPGKKLASIQALSGGERTLTSIALLCSLLTCFPSPFVVLDEVDAALDDANTIRFGQILGTLAHQTQFITITHNRETMAQAGILYGVTMGDDGVSKLLSVKLEQAKQFAK